MPKPTPGRVLLVLVRPNDNDGADTAPGIVTSVNDDGTVNLTVFTEIDAQPVGRLRGVQVVDDRQAADDELAKHVDDLPRRRDEPEPTPIDAAPWIKVAHWPDRGSPASESTPDTEPDDGPVRPADGATKAEWVDYAVATGMDREHAERKTKAELIAATGG